MSSLRSIAACSVTAGIGYLLGQLGQLTQVDQILTTASEEKKSTWIFLTSLFETKSNVDNYSAKQCSETLPSWYQFLPVPYGFKVSASSAPLETVEERSNLPSQLSQTVPTIATNRVGEIMRFGYPNLDNVRFYENYVVSYDRKNRAPHWVFEHIRAEHCEKCETIDRKNCCFKEDTSIHPFFRATNADYKGSGYDRGHLAAASNHRHSQKAMDQTFILSNVAPQVGEGFNRSAWNNLEKYTRALARKNRCVYACTGPLYLPRRETDGKFYIKYEVIGTNHVAVPTHFFKVLVIEDQKGQYEMKAFVLPNQKLPEDVKLQTYLYPVESIERAAGFLLFEKIPRKAFKLINGQKPK